MISELARNVSRALTERNLRGAVASGRWDRVEPLATKLGLTEQEKLEHLKGAYKNARDNFLRRGNTVRAGELSRVINETQRRLSSPELLEH